MKTIQLTKNGVSHTLTGEITVMNTTVYSLDGAVIKLLSREIGPDCGNQHHPGPLWTEHRYQTPHGVLVRKTRLVGPDGFYNGWEFES
jgi:hypothetical protein